VGCEGNRIGVSWAGTARLDARSEATRHASLTYIAALNTHDPDAIAACVTDDFVNQHASTMGQGVTGRAAYRGRLRAFLADFEDLHYEPEVVIADGEHAAVPYTMTATWLGGPSTPHPITLRGVFRLAVRDGLIAERTDYWDSADFLRQTAQR
jgi:steroid delta-isomerase-like uncharacterized protein